MNEADRSALRAMAARGEGACALCDHFDPEDQALPSGVRYCRRRNTWHWPGDGQDCPHFTAGDDDETTTR